MHACMHVYMYVCIAMYISTPKTNHHMLEDIETLSNKAFEFFMHMYVCPLSLDLVKK
mgnify:CR=1 FL=1